MRVAIYARYSSENQSEKSIDDQIRVCKNYIRGLINELYLDDLRKKTMRGLEGQKLRGFSTGERVFGYYTKPVGELKLNKKGQAKYEGKIHKINPEEAVITDVIIQKEKLVTIIY